MAEHCFFWEQVVLPATQNTKQEVAMSYNLQTLAFSSIGKLLQSCALLLMEEIRLTTQHV